MYSEEKAKEFFEIYKLMAKAKHASHSDMVRTFTNLCGAYMSNGRRVVGITQAAYDAFKAVNFERIPTKKDPVAVERAHINKRYDWITKMFNTEWNDPKEWWDALVKTTHELLGKNIVPVEDIIAITTSNQMDGTIPIDKDGNTLHNCITWMDTRGADACKK